MFSESLKVSVESGLDNKAVVSCAKSLHEDTEMIRIKNHCPLQRMHMWVSYCVGAGVVRFGPVLVAFVVPVIGVAVFVASTTFENRLQLFATP